MKLTLLSLIAGLSLVLGTSCMTNQLAAAPSGNYAKLVDTQLQRGHRVCVYRWSGLNLTELVKAEQSCPSHFSP